MIYFIDHNQFNDQKRLPFPLFQCGENAEEKQVPFLLKPSRGQERRQGF